jgi:hypothetical protein
MTEPETITVYISIDNSDDKLTQQEWSQYASAFADELGRWAVHIHGFWHSLPDSPFQNAAACVEIAVGDVESARRMLARLAADYRQDSIAWAVAPVTEFITPAEAVTRG